jgi:hypothetical protein
MTYRCFPQPHRRPADAYTLSLTRLLQSLIYRREASMTRLPKSVLALAAFATVALCITMRASHADSLGDSRWCAVTNKGDVMTWDCEYDSSDECASAIVGTGGYCTMNPYWRPDPSSNGR